MKKALYITGGVIALFIIIGAISEIVSPQQKSTKSNETSNIVKPSSKIADTTKSTVKKTETKQPAKSDLATRVDKDLKENLGTDSYQTAGKPFEYITGMTDQGNGWVDVNYQTDCDKDTATFVAKQIVGTVELDIDDLQTVNVMCTNGTSSYANRDSWAN